MRKCFIFIILLVQLSALSAISCAIYVDASKSMKGFTQTGSVKKITQDIIESLNTNMIDTKLFIFLSQNQSSIQHIPIELNNMDDTSLYSGSYTLLNKCLDNNLKSEIIVIITDNITTGRDANTTKFYEMLNKDSTFDLIDVLPKKLSFSGLNYSNNQYYKGEKGLLCYFIHQNIDSSSGSQSVYKKFINSISKNQNNEILHIKPINGEHFNILEKDDTFKFELDHKTKNYHLRYKSNIKPVIVSNQPFPINISFNLLSKYRYIVLDENTDVMIQNVKLANDNQEIPIKLIKSSITPKIVTNPLEYDNSQSFNCQIQFIPIINGFYNELKLLFNRDNLILSFDLQLHNKSDKLRLSKDIYDKYFTRNLNKLTHIYTPVDPINYFNNQHSFINLHVSNKGNKNDPGSCLTLKTHQEFLIIFLLLLFIVVLSLIIYFLYRYLSVKNYFVLIDSDKELHIKAHQTLDTDLFQFKSTYEGLSLTIKSSDYHYGNLAKKQAILKADRSYEISSYKYEKIIIKVTKEVK